MLCKTKRRLQFEVIFVLTIYFIMTSYWFYSILPDLITLLFQMTDQSKDFDYVCGSCGTPLSASHRC